ncbi:MAG: phenylacetate-CoA oxygenase subunit PaaJ [Burkholderiales bacterium]|nr:phenylacetate-CoA oxygenase subunit PaaJ [Burkholderiales bacterium]
MSVELVASRLDRAWALLDTVLDPEVPVVSVRDLGIVRDVIEREDGGMTVVVTPTYSGCPATEVIEQSIVDALEAAGLGPVRVEMRRAPAWTTDWMSEKGRRQLREYGIAPPGPVVAPMSAPLRFMPRQPPKSLACPRCESLNTERISAFGATACKALWRCRACGEPFEHFKPI